MVELDGLRSRVPATWKEERSTSQMRAAQFRAPKADGDKEDGEFVVFYFGPGGGGSNDENVKRWKGQFVPPEGKSMDAVTKVEKMKVGGVDVTYVDLSGTYKFKKAPFVPDGQGRAEAQLPSAQGDFRESKGPYYLSLVGPAKTVEQHKKGFDDLVKGFK